MIRWFLALAMVAAVWPAHAENLRLDIGEIRVLPMDVPVATVVVGNPKIVDVAVEGEKAVLVFGRASGSSDVVMLNAAHEVVYSARFAVNGAAEQQAEPAGRAAVAPAGATVTVRGPTEQGMAEVRWVCSADRRCRRGATE